MSLPVSSYHYACFSAMYFSHYRSELEKYGKTVTYSGQIFTDLTSLKKAVKLQLIELICTKKVTGSLKLSEMLKIVFT